ncbi:hypothetical protein ECPA45_3308, partial [Escherichia coli PA45]
MFAHGRHTRLSFSS